MPTFDWEQFCHGYQNLFIWEAFVTGKAKDVTDEKDAVIAAKTFWSRYPDISSDVTAENPYSLVGGALIRSRLTEDIRFLSQECIVIKGA